MAARNCLDNFSELCVWLGSRVHQKEKKMIRNTKALLRNRPGNRLSKDDIEVVESAVKDIQSGEFLVENKYVSIDFAMRGWLAAGRSYVPTLELGEVVRGCAAGTVVASRHDGFSEGDSVCGMLGAQSHAISNGDGVYKVNVSQAPLQRWAGGLGPTTALTAYLGLLHAGRAEGGDTVFVSGASGAVGSLVGQIAKIKGCRAVGTAGGNAKREMVLDEFGFDECIDYMTGNLAEEIAAACPDRIDVLFENVGGELFDASLLQMNTYGRVVLCGLTSDRTATEPYGLMNIRAVLMERLTMHGFILFEYVDSYQTAVNDIGSWYADGRLKLQGEEEVYGGGLPAFASALNHVLDGKNAGKVILEV